MPNPTITSAIDNGDTTYTVTFDAPVTYNGTPSGENQVITILGDNATWIFMNAVAQVDPFTITMQPQTPQTGCLAILITGQPVTFSFAAPLNIVTIIGGVT